MSDRWSSEQVLALAPDGSSRQAAAKLANPANWQGTGAHQQLIWGLCQGSGKNPYQTILDLTGPAYKCSCPSRKFPCKHALALLLNWSAGLVAETTELAGYAAEWRHSRESRATSVPKSRTDRDEPAAAKRAEQRASRVEAGLAELETWLADQVRTGLSTVTAASSYRNTAAVAARMVDAQASGVANTLRRIAGLPGTGDGWPGRLLAEYAQLHLLARAHRQLGTLPPDLAAVVRARVGYTVAREDVLNQPAVADCWQVLAVRELPDAAVPARRIWLRGKDTGRPAMLLIFAPNGNFGGNLDATLQPGTELAADLHYYPGLPALRAVIGARRAEQKRSTEPESADDIEALLTAFAGALGQDPWLLDWPALLIGRPQADGPRWQLVDPSGRAVPLLSSAIDIWTMVAVSGGHPITVAGEWSPDGLLPLTVWHGDQAVRL